MKKLLLLFIVCNSVAATIKAQTNVYHPFPNSNAIWNIYFSSACIFGGIDVENYSITISEDTVINTQIYHKLNIPFVQYDTDGFCGIVHVAGYKGAIRQDALNKKVFYIPPTDSTEQLLYDFNMQVGDTVKGFLETFSYQDDTVISIDSVMVGSTYRKRWNINNCYNMYLIEGIGSTYGLIEYSPGCIVDQSYYIISCFQQNGQTLYPDTTTNCQIISSVNSNDEIYNQVKVFPNPSTGVIKIYSDKKITAISLYNIFGKIIFSQNHINSLEWESTVLENLPDGCYFIKYYTETSMFLSKIIKIE